MPTNEAAAPAAAAHPSKWKWIALAVVLLALVAINLAHVWPLITHLGMKGFADFFSFYGGSRMFLYGPAAELYDPAGLYQKSLMAYNHPAYELLFFLPFSFLPLTPAFWAWNSVNVLLLIVIAWLLPKQRQGLPGSGVGWIVLESMAFFPVVLTFMQGQDSILMLLIFTLVYRCLSENRQFLAGTVLAAALFKFTLILPFCLPWVLRRRWRFTAGLATGGTLVVAICFAMVGMTGSRNYVALLLGQFSNKGSSYFDPRWMATVHGLLATVLSILHVAVAPHVLSRISWSIGLLLMLFAAWYLVDGGEGSRFDLWFSMVTFAATLSSPYLFGHNLAPVFLALVLANRALATASARSRITCWILSGLLFCSPLYLYLQNHEALGLFALPMLAMLFLLACASRRSETYAQPAA